MMNIDRRSLLWSMTAMAAPFPLAVFGQDDLLPVRTPGLDHLDVMVPDVEASASFYMSLFNTELHAQPFRDGFRYFVLLGELNNRREVGYLAVGDSRGEDAYIGHFCTTVLDWRETGEAVFSRMTDEFAAGGFGAFPGSTGFGGIFSDPDGIEIQFLPAPDTLVTAADPSDLTPWHQGVVTPHGVDHILLRVSDLERALEWYSILYGQFSRDEESNRPFFEFSTSATRIYLEQARYEYGQQPEIAHFGIKVDPYDRQKVSSVVEDLGGTVLSESDDEDVLRIRDPDGNIVELVPVPA